MAEKIYPSKLLLFGEYAIICGGEGMAVPYSEFFAKWYINKGEDSKLKKYIVQFTGYLEKEFPQDFDFKKIKSDAAERCDIDSNIPVGYGVGSSGAVVAAMYDRYCINKINTDDLSSLKEFLGRMENYFHGKSSGLDPLVSYLNKSFHAKGNSETEIINRPHQLKNYSFSLFDTGINRFTNKLIKIFNEKLINTLYHQKIYGEYLPLTKQCIHYYLSGDENKFISSLHTLSAFQLQYFDFAIPEKIKAMWKDALISGNKIFKLCGAGAGGFMLCFTKKNFTE